MTNNPSGSPPLGADRLGRPVGEQVGLRRLVAERLGVDPVSVACELRAQTPPMAWNRIAQVIMQRTALDGQEPIYLTQEAVRRWVRKHEESQLKAA